MEVTDVKIYPVGEEKLQAFVSVVLDHCFRISDIKIIQGNSGRFLSMPSKRRKDGTYRDIAHPLNSDTRDYLERVIFDHYDSLLEGSAADRSTSEHAASPNGGALSQGTAHGGLAADAATPAEGQSQLMT
jgi:stage V sporulation protein G